MRRFTALLLTLGVGVGVLTGCSDDGDDEATNEPTSQAPVVRTEPAKPAPRPAVGRCYRLTLDQAIAPTTEAKPTGCTQRHTARTFFVGTLDTVVDGHLLAVDSARVDRQVEATCLQRFAAYVGGSAEDRRLSMLRTAWFSPTLDQSDEGQSWLRCDVIALETSGRLATLSGPTAGVLDSSEGQARWGRCATGKPGTKGSEHVVCSRNDAWRAIASVAVPAGRGGAWPGEAAARGAGDGCESRVRSLADDPLSFSWGYEWPTRRQWASGQHHGYCWAPRDP